VLITEELATKVRDVVNMGLTHGVGIQVPGKMCIEAAVCYALGMPHGDRPPCVGSEVRVFKICLNDSGWSSDMARSAGMRKLAIAQLGSDNLDQVKFVQDVAIGMLAKMIPDAVELFPFDTSFWPELADCRTAKTIDEAATRISALRAAFEKHRITVGFNASYPIYSVVVQLENILRRIESGQGTGNNTESLVSTIRAIDSLHIHHRPGVEPYSYRAAAVRDEILAQGADIALDALKDSPGYQYLYLLDGGQAS
jgi:hypothetical protein